MEHNLINPFFKTFFCSNGDDVFQGFEGGETNSWRQFAKRKEEGKEGEKKE